MNIYEEVLFYQDLALLNKKREIVMYLENPEESIRTIERSDANALLELCMRNKNFVYELGNRYWVLSNNKFWTASDHIKSLYLDLNNKYDEADKIIKEKGLGGINAYDTDSNVLKTLQPLINTFSTLLKECAIIPPDVTISKDRDCILRLIDDHNKDLREQLIKYHVCSFYKNAIEVESISKTKN